MMPLTGLQSVRLVFTRPVRPALFEAMLLGDILSIGEKPMTIVITIIHGSSLSHY